MQTEKHAPEALTIEEVFTAARHYRVPVYQRAYAWTQVEISTLLADVRRARLRSEKPDTQGASSDYYLGSLVVNRATTPEGVPIDEVVDGQQRLTTLTVLAWLNLVTPNILLALCFVVGSGMALMGPAWQAIQPDLVPPTEFPQAVALSSLTFNAGRAIGPALGGALVAAPLRR